MTGVNFQANEEKYTHIIRFKLLGIYNVQTYLNFDEFNLTLRISKQHTYKTFSYETTLKTHAYRHKISAIFSALSFILAMCGHNYYINLCLHNFVVI